MNGRIFKFRLETEPISGNIDNFLDNIVKCRKRNQIFLSKGRVALGSILQNDLIFIQTNGYLTHYMECSKQGPEIIDNNIEISVTNIIKLAKPVKSKYKGQGYNKLSKSDISEILEFTN
jgi:hypothetical protein